MFQDVEIFGRTALFCTFAESLYPIVFLRLRFFEKAVSTCLKIFYLFSLKISATTCLLGKLEKK